MLQIEVEEAVKEYRKHTLIHRDKTLSEWYLSFIRSHVQKLFCNLGLPWDDRAEYLLQGCCMYYDLRSKVSFLGYVLEVVKMNYDLNISEKLQNDFYSGQVYKGNGAGTFQRTWTSTPERIATERTQAAANRRQREERKAMRMMEQDTVLTEAEQG